MATPETTPVIVGIGEFVDRPERAADALEPVALMAKALRAADDDAGSALLQQIESLELIGLISWRYRDPVKLLCDQLGIQPARTVNASMGGETPIRLIHDAALRISRGELTTAAIVGGEAMHAMTRSRKEGHKPTWTELAPKQDTVRFPSSSFEISPIARRIGVTDPAQIYPLYEMATQAAWQQSPADAQQESAQLWAQFASVAASNPNAWIRSAPTADAIATVSDQNRLINWPYTKLMVANPMVNQAAAVIVTSLAHARKAGIPEHRLIHIWGGAAANEPEDYLKRDRYDRSTAQSAVLKQVVDLVGGDARRFDRMELYSCFPVVPKMALRTLGLDAAQRAPTVTGGLTFFGGPLNNYMTHAVCAMVRTLREHPSEVGLLYGQGGFVNKHHALIVSTQPPQSDLAADYSVQRIADQQRDPVPPLADSNYHGPATIETYTILYGRDGEPLQGVVVARNPAGERVMARIPTRDAQTMQLLASRERSAVGALGQVHVDAFDLPVWEVGDEPRDRSRIERQFCKVEREGPLTIVTINRPEAMNSLHPDSNAELAEIFDEFEADPEQWVAILTGAGDRAFSSGNDLKYMAQAMARGASIEPPVKGFAGLTNRYSLNKPVIAAVNGIAMGGGFEIALACDLIIASSTAKFALPEPKVGVAALAGGLLRLPQQIGTKRAMSLILTGRSVSADEGLELGFVNQVTSPETLMQEARRWAGQIAACSPMSIRASKEIVQRGLDEVSLAAAYSNQMAYPAARALFRSSDFREGPTAFAQKRAPRWKSE